MWDKDLAQNKCVVNLDGMAATFFFAGAKIQIHVLGRRARTSTFEEHCAFFTFLWDDGWQKTLVFDATPSLPLVWDRTFWEHFSIHFRSRLISRKLRYVTFLFVRNRINNATTNEERTNTSLPILPRLKFVKALVDASLYGGPHGRRRKDHARAII